MKPSRAKSAAVVEVVEAARVGGVGDIVVVAEGDVKAVVVEVAAIAEAVVAANAATDSHPQTFFQSAARLDRAALCICGERLILLLSG